MNVAAHPRRHALRIEILEARIAPALITTLTWQGDAATNGWADGTLNTNTNWLSNLGAHKIPVDGNLLVFPASAGQKNNANNISGLDLKSLSFTGDGYTTLGSPLTLAGGLTAKYATTGTNKLNIPITLTADQTFAFSGNTGGEFDFESIIFGGKALTVDTTFKVLINGGASAPLTGSGTLIKNGAGELAIGSLGGTGSFAGPVQVNAGILTVGTITGLGASGAGNATTVASGATVATAFGGTTTLAEDFILSGTGTASQGALVIAASNSFNPTVSLTGSLRLGANATVAAGSFNGFDARLRLAGAVGAADDALAILTMNAPNAAQFAFTNTATFTTELAGTTPGAGGHDQLKVIGPVDLGGAALNVVPSFSPAVGAKFVLVDNDGTDAITGTFAGLAEGATLTAGGINFKISYAGGTNNNDVVLTVDGLVETPLPVTLSADAKTATFTDRDGDLVTVKTTKGAFLQSDFKLVAAGVAGGGQLQQINLTTHAADFVGAGITITAKPGPLGGNGFVNVGYLNANGIDLGAVKIAGDLGRLAAGTVGGDAKVPGVKALTVESIGLLGTSTQAAGSFLGVAIQGALPKLAIKGDLRASLTADGGTDGRIGAAAIGGSIVATGGLTLRGEAGIGVLKVGGDIRNEGNSLVSIETRTGPLGAISVGGSIVGKTASATVNLAGNGQTIAPQRGLDLAIVSLDVRGSVEFANIQAGALGADNADASIGAITVAGDWIASSVQAGARAGADFRIGTQDDGKTTAPRDNPNLFSTIGSFTVKGQALGTAATATDMFGVVAERIGKAKVGGRTFAFTSGATPEAFFAAPTLDGEGTENPAFDFTIRELGSTTPAGALGGPNLAVSGDGKTATFTDVDGDLVTVTRSAGTFAMGDFTIAAAASGGGLLRALTITPAPGGVATNLSITAKVGPGGGNGFVNVGSIDAGQTDLGNVVIGGELQDLDVGDNDAARAGLGSLVVHALGAVAGTAPTGDEINSAHGIGKIVVQTDVRDFHIFANNSGNGNLASLTVGGALLTAEVNAAANLGAIKIAGSVLGNSRIQATGRIGALALGGDVATTTIEAFAQQSGPAKGLDLALKSLTVKGSVEKTNVILGRNSNADASLGAITVGRAWLASSVLAGVEAGVDGFIGTNDDRKISQGSPADLARFSTIASLVIKGQALGTATVGDSFGIVAEQILKAKIGTRTFAFKATTKEAFAAAPTGPGPAPDNTTSDFFLREIGT